MLLKALCLIIASIGWQELTILHSVLRPEDIHVLMRLRVPDFHVCLDLRSAYQISTTESAGRNLNRF